MKKIPIKRDLNRDVSTSLGHAQSVTQSKRLSVLMGQDCDSGLEIKKCRACLRNEMRPIHIT